MGGVMITRVVDQDGGEKYVTLTGAEKAMVYRMLAQVGIFERDVPEGQIPPEELQAPNLAERPGVEPPYGSFNASTMHCCEAAEIVFEDIT